MSRSYWDDSSFESESEMSRFETGPGTGSEGMFIPSSASNESRGDVETVYGMK